MMECVTVHILYLTRSVKNRVDLVHFNLQFVVVAVLCFLVTCAVVLINF